MARRLGYRSIGDLRAAMGGREYVDWIAYLNGEVRDAERQFRRRQQQARRRGAVV